VSKIPDEEVKSSAIKFDLYNLKLELDGMLEKLKGNSVALRQFHELLSDALENCSQAIAEIDTSKGTKRRIPHD
jgi:hypothetical protein